MSTVPAKKIEVTVDLGNTAGLPVFKLVDGVLVRKENDARDPDRRYTHETNVMTGDSYFREYTDEEERQANADYANWLADAPKREAAAEKEKADADAFIDSLKYETRLVAFLDLLGWSRAVVRAPKDEALVKKLGLVLGVIKNVSAAYNFQREFLEKALGEKDIDWPGGVRVTHFSDCVVASTPDSPDGKRDLINFLTSLYSLLPRHGFVLRGGIVRGEIYHTSQLIFGPALIEAYGLESQIAVHPRVILSTDLAGEWGVGDDGAKTWRVDNDGRSYYDFLQPFGGVGFFHTPQLVAQSLAPMRKFIVDALELFEEDRKVRPKYIWLTKYFNAVCGESEGHDVEIIPLPKRRLMGMKLWGRWFS